MFSFVNIHFTFADNYRFSGNYNFQKRIKHLHTYFHNMDIEQIQNIFGVPEVV